MSAFCETWSGNLIYNRVMLSRDVWRVTASSWNHVSKSKSIYWKEKLFNTALSASFSKGYGQITPPLQNAHQIVDLCGCISSSWITWFVALWLICLGHWRKFFLTFSLYVSKRNNVALLPTWSYFWKIIQ